MIEKVTRVGLLYDIYGSLLTQRQRQMVELYYFDDWSLAEVAETVRVSRQAVHDNLRRAEELLEGYEGQLQLLRTKQQLQTELNALQTTWAEVRKFVPEETAVRMEDSIRSLQQQV
jgi:predicted DNA-binding protein YlxM (UPF0122 family)